MGNRTRLLVWTIVALLVFRPETASADSPAESHLRTQHGELTSLLAQPKNSSRDQKITAIMDRVFDYDDLARRSLGDDWTPLSPSDRDEFKKLLEQLIRQSYRKQLDKTNGWEISYGASKNIDGGMRVPTTAKHKTDKRKEPISIDYLLHEANGQWRVYDVVIEGSSLVGNYQSQFRKIVRKKGFGELTARMRRKLASGSSQRL